MFSKLIARSLPLMPRALVGRVAGRYIAGAGPGEAVELAGRLVQHGFSTTIDVLGEDVLDENHADIAASEYLTLMDRMHAAHSDRNISIKLSQLGIRLDEGAAFRRLEQVIAVAAQRDFFLRLDMEDATLTDITLDFYLRARKLWPRVGVVLQSRLKRTLDDARRLSGEDANFRLCKGIYPEHEGIAYFDANEIRASYLEILRGLLDGGSYVGLATHDLGLIESCRKDICLRNLARDAVEFQALLGVPIRSTLEGLLADGFKVRIYVPFGADWYAYSLRRLEENPQIAGSIALSLFKRDRLDSGSL